MFEAVIGLEVHLHLRTRTKMFSACRTDYFGEGPNTFTDPLTLGLPGTLPTLNAEAVDLAIMFGLALNCDVLGFTQFHRKNYFYPDAPKNFQISQYDRPIARDGYVDLAGQRIRIKRAHLEDDAGKLVHPDGEAYSLIDLNRAGMPLIEMVTEPDIQSPEQARDFLQHIRAVAQALGVSDANPEEGKMRCDVNVSVRRPGEPLGTKVEVKNLNSFRSVQRALEYEIERQGKLLAAGGRITQDTLGWDDAAGRTYLMRTKEGEADYRYFPEPDLPPLNITPEWIERVRARMPEVPAQKEARYLELGIRAADAAALSQSVTLSRFLDAALSGYSGKAQTLVNWLMGDVAGWLAARELDIAASRLTPPHLVALVRLIDEGTISGKMAKDLLPEVMEGADPAALVRERGLAVVTDTAAIEAAIRTVMERNPEVVERVRAGNNPKAINALFGPIMKETGGSAKPELVRELLNRALGLG
ncbi:aspartyl-tRNA(Asn)/glutamyl-tRNA(Gln) amidotransferase subunit B [Deinobacterium chartae]|uniref:Aspartyl/glutamyl-tRNA(Asn/Gln) amidotransferase subunit B n=1 Tax=Deinobacterium chartae TaxID=521158 RepID=A0A841I155_9DEIO|nr:Asp-tRNA(Asn)/Glu-tRNA(Gln) amidotransferase subunit GatB [Deinobacterium chartae]MBB6098963.1 aspartyl-tRNA(Asn)/glutamyl-tRNA(Gln) amidotransferase subunit B [Deinobacterium chartae]